MDNVKSFFILLFTAVYFCGCSALVRQPYNAAEVADKITPAQIGRLTPSAPLTSNLSPIVPNSQPATPAVSPLAPISDKLSKNLWVRNNELERYLENGSKEDGHRKNSEQLRRMSEINVLNLSRKEAAKENRHSFEYSGGLISTWRWYNPEIETLLASPHEEQQDISEFITGAAYQDKKFIMLRNNAVILLARGYSYSKGTNGFNINRIKDLLKQTIENNSLPVELRCAAAETLGHTDDVFADDFLPLIENVKEKPISKVNPKTGVTENKLSQGVADLWIELLNSLAQKSYAWEHSCFIEALNAKNPKVRLAAVKFFNRTEHRDGTATPSAVENIPEHLPEAFLQYAKKEVEPLIRAEICGVLGQWKEPSILEIVRSDLNGLAVQRNAAMDALAEADCREAIPLIKEKLYAPIGKNRAKAVEILRRYGCLDDVFKQSDDTSREVRLEVAKTLAVRCTPQTKEIADKYLSDTVQVQEAVLESVSVWRMPDSYPILLKALQCNLKSIRQNAAEKLAKFIPEAENYDTDALPRTMGGEYETLVRLCNELAADITSRK